MIRPLPVSIAVCALLLALASPGAVAAQDGIDIPAGNGVLHVELTTADTVHVQFLASGGAAPPSLVIDPATARHATSTVAAQRDGVQRLDSPQLHVSWDPLHRDLAIADARHRIVLRQHDPAAPGQGRLAFAHAPGDATYGIGGYDATEDASTGLLRTGRQQARAGEQGHAGAPFVWSTAGYGILLDAIGATFELGDSRITANMPAAHPDYYVFVGQPEAIFGTMAAVSGRTPLFPKWAMGFTNSQWGIDENELLRIVDTYRARHIPIDNFTLDFDWKAWGEDDYGEFRWNTAKFPDGPDGKLKRALDRRGMQLSGIMKPRIHVDTAQGRHATAHGFWATASKAAPDYFSKKPVRELDFDQPAVRAWFFNEKLKQSFDTGMHGWWNDEADDIGSDTQFTNMQRALYDGQRSISNLRVWSLNRNFYLGAQRYAYGLWSGDIATGFASMAGQRARMLSAIDVGAMQWGMDGGGFKDGTPTPENYARWIQFGAFTPIFRVHGVFGQKRQPWVYGPIAEKAATDAIRLRYSLIPYIYSYESSRRDTGVGLVRPLLFGWPHDRAVRNDVDAWMFGDWLLASPVVEQGQKEKDVYLPAGQWIDWSSGKRYDGGRTVHLATDATHWSDIPLFIRAGAIIPMQPVEDYVGQHPLTEIAVETFPATQRSSFDYYDDDGRTYDYEQGHDYRQALSTRRSGNTVQLDVGAPRGRFRPALRFYLFRVHGGAADRSSGSLHRFDSLAALARAGGEGWATGHDRYGDVTWVRLAATRPARVILGLEP